MSFKLDRPHPLSISEAIQEWLPLRYTGQMVRYHDDCLGPHCNQLCLEEVVLGGVVYTWPHVILTIFSVAVVAIATGSVIIKCHTG